MAKKTAAGLVEFCKQCLNAKLGYVYGSFGRICTKSLLDSCAKLYPAPNLAGGRMRTVGEKWLGRRVVDCSGMIKYYLMTDKFGEDPKYTQELDLAVHITKASKSGDIKSLPEVPGTILWMPGHVGVYIGNGEVIESKGTEYGVKQTKLVGRGWQKWFWIKEIDYTTNQSSSSKPVITLDTKEYSFDEIGKSYTVLAKCTDKPEITVDNPKIVSVSYLSKDSRGHLFSIKALAQGMATVTVKVNGGTATVKVSVGCDIDTTEKTLAVGESYTFLTRSINKPDIDIDDVSVAEVTYKGSDSRGHLFNVKAKKSGTAKIVSKLGKSSDRMVVKVK